MHTTTWFYSFTQLEITFIIIVYNETSMLSAIKYAPSEEMNSGTKMREIVECKNKIYCGQHKSNQKFWQANFGKCKFRRTQPYNYTYPTNRSNLAYRHSYMVKVTKLYFSKIGREKHEFDREEEMVSRIFFWWDVKTKQNFICVLLWDVIKCHISPCQSFISVRGIPMLK